MKSTPSILILNDARPAGSAPQIHCLIRNKEDTSKPVEILIYDTIGKTWDGEGFDLKDFADHLKGIDENRDLEVRVNSRGGIVDEGIAIYNRLKEWKGKTVAIVDGGAASIASVLIMGADEVHMPESAEILIHEAHALVVAEVNGDDLDRLYDELKPRLDSASDRIAGIYAAKSGRSREEMRNYMRKTSIFNGRQAKELGLCDVLTDAIPLYNFTPEEISRFRVEMGRKPPTKPAQNSGATASPMKKKLLALLNKHGIKASDGKALDTLNLEELFALAETSITNGALKQADYDATLVEAKAPPPPAPAPSNDATITTLQNTVNQLLKLNEGEKRTRITAEVDGLIANNQLPGVMRDKAITRAMADETILDEYKAMPSVAPGVEPLNTSIEIVSEDPKAISTAIAVCDAPVQAWKRGSDVKMTAIRDAAMNRGRIINANLDKKIIPLWNTNTIATELKRNVILQVVIKDFARKLMPLTAFSTVFQSVPLEGTNKVEVPFYDLDTSASRSFSSGTGYTKVGNTTTDKREIEVGEGVTNGDRLFQDMSFTSQEIARQPYLKIVELFGLKVDKLASDLFTDVLGIVTAANFGAAAVVATAGQFDSVEMANLKLACKLWPDQGRSVLLDSDYDANLMKDQVFVTNLNAGPGVIREGKIGSRAYGFDYYEIPTIPANGEDLKGFAVFQSAILVATAPVPPVQEVRNAGTQYSLIVDPQTGVAFEYRSFGDNTLDTAVQVVEVNYGFAKGNANALKRITAS